MNSNGSWKDKLARRNHLGSWVSTLRTEGTRPTISFGGGLPDPASLPTEALAKSINYVLKNHSEAALQYGGTEGYEGLRELLAKKLSENGTTLKASNFVIVNGASSALAHACSLFIDPGDTVILEDPSYSGSISTIKFAEAKMVGVTMEPGGLDMEMLGKKLKELAKEKISPKFFYSIPNFHNPMGSTMSLEKRKALLEYAREYDFLIIEDETYTALRFDGNPVPSMYILDKGHRVIQIGTFSKTLAPGLRLGWVMGNEEIIEYITSRRTDMGSSPLIARAIAQFIQDGHYEPHLAKVIDIYRRKRDTLIAGLGERCANLAQWTAPEGGFFLWLNLKKDIDPQMLRQAGAEEGVSVITGSNFYLNGGGKDKVRMAFSYVSQNQIEEGVVRVDKVLRRLLSSSKSK
ncbi:MAG: PLP-dependent aminotransferase family protein [Dehalococcoidia bacterium]|nr:PLP-dependent aminotransferase family protein [Dehalococcoidia bacterium]